MTNQGFKLEQLFGSKTRARLIGLFVENPESRFFVRELTRKIDAQLNSVRRELKNLLELGIVIEKENAPVAAGKKQTLNEKKKFYSINADSILFSDLKTLFKKVKILARQSLVQEIEESGDIYYFAFTGKFCDLVGVPTDLLIVGDIDQKQLQKIVKNFENELAEEINYTLMPKDEFIYRKQVTDKFLFSILESEKVVMVNKI